MHPELSIIIVNYNGEHYLSPCLDSIFNHPISVPFEVIVVDNASTDNSFQLLQNSPHPIELILNTENVGFSAGNNQGIARAKGIYLFFLNNDTIVHKDSISKLLGYLKQHPDTGLIGPKLLNPDGSLQCPGSFLGRRQYAANVPKKVSFLAGAAWMMRADIMHEMGGFDPHFFFYNEDIDICKQLTKMGRPIVYLPESEITHLGGQSTRTLSAKAMIEGYRGGLYLCKKHYPKLVYWLYCGVLFLFFLLRIGFHGLLFPFSARHRTYFNASIQILHILLRGQIYYEK